MQPYKLLFGKERRFGLFIHWGLYALTEHHEQTLYRTDIGREAYEALRERFDPFRFSAEEWVLLAKNAGMRYICLTAKHCDGFCLWDTKETDYNVMNTPFKRDIVKEFADVCAKHDIGFALYYSTADWHHPNGYNPMATHQIPPRETDEPNMTKYMAYVRRQITELMTNYGTICALFWDVRTGITDPSMNEMVRELQPGIRINDRGYDKGDYSTPERFVPDGAFEKLTEACQSVGVESWGYRRHEDFYTARYLEESIDSILCRGGNYLLNIGPMPDGSIPMREQKLLRKVGSWFNRVKESYDGDAPTDLFSEHEEFTVTRNGDDLYLHFTRFPSANGFSLYPIDFLPEQVTLLNTGETPLVSLDVMPWKHMLPNGKAPCLHIHDLPFDELSSEVPVLKIRFRDIGEVERKLGKAKDDGIGIASADKF